MTIQEALDRCLEDISSGGSTMEECLARYPQYASQLRPLLRTASRLEAVNEVRPSRAFKSRLRKQLAGEEEKPRRRWFSLRSVVVWVLIVLLVASFAVWMGINLEVAGRSTTPFPVNYSPSVQARPALAQSSYGETGRSSSPAWVGTVLRVAAVRIVVAGQRSGKHRGGQSKATDVQSRARAAKPGVPRAALSRPAPGEANR